MTICDLAGIGSHNKREKKAYQSNSDIKLELPKNNIEQSTNKQITNRLNTKE